MKMLIHKSRATRETLKISEISDYRDSAQLDIEVLQKTARIVEL